MYCSDSEKSVSNALLEDVFYEIESLEPSICEEKKNSKTSKFLEDVFITDISDLSNKKIIAEYQETLTQPCNTKHSKEIESLIHGGLTDSSDDEDNKYFEEKKYSEYGKIIKNLIEEKKCKNSSLKDNSNIEIQRAASQSTKDLLTFQLNKVNGSSKTEFLSETSAKNPFVDPILGMRIINPLVSSSNLKMKMTGRITVGTSKIKQFIGSSSKDQNWVTGGAIIGKTMKKSQKGNPYCVWSVSDLTGSIRAISVLLFGSAYNEHWKTCLGTVVGILNPTILDSKEKFEAVLRIDNAQKILIIGKSKDYGFCRSKKKNGENCSSVVNTANCDFCTYHIKKEYDKACRRSDLQPPKIGRNVNSLRAKVLGKNTVCYNGKVFSAVTPNKSSQKSEKDKEKLKILSQKPSLNLAQTSKDKNILNKLNANTKHIITSDISKLSNSKDIDLNFTISRKDVNKAKQNALKYIQQHGPFKKAIENAKIKKTPEQILSLKRRIETEDSGSSKKPKIGTSENPPDTEKLNKNGITNTFLKLMNSQAQNNDFLKMAEYDQREKYFNKLEVREKIEDKMAATFKVECKAVRCLQCNYKSFSASELCKKEKHSLKIVNAVKRFWKCGECSARTVSLELIPLNSCKTCGSSKWVRASMLPDKKENLPFVEPLSLRGHEEKFIGANVKSANLNLLVPEESS